MTPLARIEEVTIRHNGHVVTLRPSLRAAMTLERLHGGWEPLISRLSETHVITMQAIIRASAVSSTTAEALLAALQNQPLARVHAVLVEPLCELVNLFLEPAKAETGTEPRTGKPMTWPEAYAELYRIGTGWLGWNPAETWAATPTEITQAFEGKVSYLKAIYGSRETEERNSGTPAPYQAYTAEQLAQIEAQGFDPAFDRAALRGLA
ncbi:phage tail assembly chaperone [Mangrovicoccus ximenensis]|uniref:phage tail assembly chaperone n=1 Tax=Mangrovicoccus ximenensis TaxID=1911570 RepID=UPI000D3BE424|nr:phage tail assembly chaperone [Mangrovicoccus ximenensis]